MKKTLFLLIIFSTTLTWIWVLSLITAQLSFLASTAMTVSSSWIAATITTILWIGIDMAFIRTISQPFFEGRATTEESLFLLFATIAIVFQSGEIWNQLEKITASDQPIIVVLIAIALISIQRIGLLIIISRLWTEIDSYLPD